MSAETSYTPEEEKKGFIGRALSFTGRALAFLGVGALIIAAL